MPPSGASVTGVLELLLSLDTTDRRLANFLKIARDGDRGVNYLLGCARAYQLPGKTDNAYRGAMGEMDLQDLARDVLTRVASARGPGVVTEFEVKDTSRQARGADMEARLCMAAGGQVLARIECKVGKTVIGSADVRKLQTTVAKQKTRGTVCGVLVSESRIVGCPDNAPVVVWQNTVPTVLIPCVQGIARDQNLGVLLALVMHHLCDMHQWWQRPPPVPATSQAASVRAANAAASAQSRASKTLRSLSHKVQVRLKQLETARAQAETTKKGLEMGIDKLVKAKASLDQLLANLGAMSVDVAADHREVQALSQEVWGIVDTGDETEEAKAEPATERAPLSRHAQKRQQRKKQQQQRQQRQHQTPETAILVESDSEQPVTALARRESTPEQKAAFAKVMTKRRQARMNKAAAAAPVADEPVATTASPPPPPSPSKRRRRAASPAPPPTPTPPVAVTETPPESEPPGSPSISCAQPIPSDYEDDAESSPLSQELVPAPPPPKVVARAPPRPPPAAPVAATAADLDDDDSDISVSSVSTSESEDEAPPAAKAASLAGRVRKRSSSGRQRRTKSVQKQKQPPVAKPTAAPPSAAIVHCEEEEEDTGTGQAVAEGDMFPEEPLPKRRRSNKTFADPLSQTAPVVPFRARKPQSQKPAPVPDPVVVMDEGDGDEEADTEEEAEGTRPPVAAAVDPLSSVAQSQEADAPASNTQEMDAMLTDIEAMIATEAPLAHSNGAPWRLVGVQQRQDYAQVRGPSL